MYFVTPSKPGIFLIGMYDSRLYGFGENKNSKLCIYQKSIFDCGDWEEFFMIDINVMKSECCDDGLHVATGIDDTIMWIAARDNAFTRLFSIDIFTKQFTAYKSIFLGRLSSRYLNLCCKCFMPIIRYKDYNPDTDVHRFLITPRQFKKDKEIFQCSLLIHDSDSYYIIKKNNISFHHEPASALAFNDNDVILSIHERSKEDGRIKTLMLNTSFAAQILHIPDNFIWHDMTFFIENCGKIFVLIREEKVKNVTLRLGYIEFPNSANDDIMKFFHVHIWNVDHNFPSFDSSPFIFSYHLDDVTDTYKYDFIVLQMSDTIVTVPLRMLSLSESAFLSLRQIPEPPQAVAKDDDSKKKKKIDDPWMSLNYIKKTLGLSKKFDLR